MPLSLTVLLSELHDNDMQDTQDPYDGVALTERVNSGMQFGDLGRIVCGKGRFPGVKEPS